MHIGLVIWALYYTCGGIERFGVELSAEMIRRGHRVTIFHGEPGTSDTPSQYLIPPEAVCVALPKERRSPTMIELTRDRIVASDVDVLAALFSWDDVLRFPVALEGTGIPFLLSEHNVPGVIESRMNIGGRRACLEAADRIHILLESFRKGCPAHLNDRMEAIPNPIWSVRKPLIPQSEGEVKTLLAVGRFFDQHKQFFLLIKAFASIAAQFPDWRLTLCGDGQDREAYEQLVASLNMHDRVFMPGMVDDVGSYYANSHLFCIPSRYEGFGLVTVEAQNYGLAVVGFAGCPGTNEIVVHEKNGLLAEEMTAESLAQSLSLLMADPGQRQRLGLCGQEMLVRYDAKTVYDQWEKMLVTTAHYKGNTQLQRMRRNRYRGNGVQKELKRILLRKDIFKRKKTVK